jgi:hypothetical protein
MNREKVAVGYVEIQIKAFGDVVKGYISQFKTDITIRP